MPKTLYSITVDPPQHNIVSEANISATSNYWRQQDATILQNLKLHNNDQQFNYQTIQPSLQPSQAYFLSMYLYHI